MASIFAVIQLFPVLGHRLVTHTDRSVERAYSPCLCCQHDFEFEDKLARAMLGNVSNSEAYKYIIPKFQLERVKS
ncbi:hypothetical protein BJ138DRAFT_1147260 [Hygrophoropsis aurantiaca]|uniref:Uncharacterized protein n=1 Tax=Hygrophoropsis aurantiaca TaxID=72124 RepID=A0ACB8AIE1_9AGAM|nr:hypothetical protein BJ138DRAFT_1147260 [Hygrophoropsis aurantiaca]